MSQVTKHTGFAIEMPDGAPALGFDPTAAAFSWRDVMPSNFWNLDELEERRQMLGGWPVFTPARVVVKPVYDPAEFDGRAVPPEALEPRLVLEFAESAPALVLNKSRCQQMTDLTGTPNPALWVSRLGPVELSVSVYNKKAQIVINLAPVEDEVPESWGKPTEPTQRPTAQRPAAGRQAAAVDELNRNLYSR